MPHGTSGSSVDDVTPGTRVDDNKERLPTIIEIFSSIKPPEKEDDADTVRHWDLIIFGSRLSNDSSAGATLGNDSVVGAHVVVATRTVEPPRPLTQRESLFLD